MNEKLLQFIWRYQHFHFTDLESTTGEQITVVNPGQFNTHQGPDFLEAKIKLGDTILVGHIELHVKSSHWERHRHEEDAQYGNIVLHVVWQDDKPIKSLHPFATLELQSYVSNILLERYDYLLMQPLQFVSCQNYLPVLSELSWINWKERLGLERLKRKSVAILENVEQYKGDWASVFWEEISSGFGIKVNAEAFRQMARTIPIAIVRRQRESLQTLEALLFGQTGLLNRDFEEVYPNQLKKEYQYCKQKYQLKSSSVPVVFLRMHPRNFPTIRLAQLAQLLYVSAHLFTKILEAETLFYIRELLDVTAHDYWNDHFVFDKLSPQSHPKKLGDSMVDILLINCIVPVVFAYGTYRQEEAIQEKALTWLSEIKPESNTIIQQWKSLKVNAANALESQALLELFNQYCQVKKCLSCNVGIKYLNNKE